MSRKRLFDRKAFFALFFLTLLGALPTLAETQEPNQTVLKELRYIDATQLEDFLSALPLTVVIKPELDTVLLTGPAPVVETALKVIDGLDAAPPPRPSIEIRGFLVAVSKDDETVDVPGELDGVISELRETFSYTGFRVLDIVFLRTADGSGGQTVGRAVPENSPSQTYRLAFNRGRILDFDRAREEEKEHSLRFEGLVLGALGEVPSLATDVELREGQKAVIGKGRLPGVPGDVILVIEGKVLDSTVP